MCNDYRYRLPIERLIEEFSHQKIPLVFPSGIPNTEPRDDIRISDSAPVVLPGPEGASLQTLPWSWKGPTGKPVFNFRSDGRRFPSGRCLIPADGFYEFTTPEDPSKKRKDKWLFTLKGAELFAIAGVVREGAWAMLTTAPGPDIAPYHDRQVVLLRPEQWADWLSSGPNEAQLLVPTPPGALTIEQVG